MKNETDEAKCIRDRILELVAEKFPLGEIAVIYRTKRQVGDHHDLS